jgi:hypothetical protein
MYLSCLSTRSFLAYSQIWMKTLGRRSKSIKLIYQVHDDPITSTRAAEGFFKSVDLVSRFCETTFLFLHL